MRLVSDVSKEQKSSSEVRMEMESIIRERDVARSKVVEKEMDVEKLHDQLKHSQRAWTETRKELEEKISE